MLLITVALATIAAPACASGKWRTPQLVALAAAETAVAADCATTAVALRDAQLIETNPLLGRRPSPERLAVTCALAGTAVWAVSERTRGAARWVWLGAVFGAGVWNATHNWNVVKSQRRSVPSVTVRGQVSF